MAAWRSLFRASPPAAPLSAGRVLLGAVLAVAGVAVVLLRLGGDPLSFVWAEDGGIFLERALNASVPDAVLSNYAGYLHLVPRLLAELAAALPIGWSSQVLALAGALVTVLCAYVVWRASAAHLPDPLLRGTLAAMVILLPVVGFETLANVTNLQWMMLFASFWLLLWRPPSRRAAIAAGAFVALTLASAPLALLLTPLAALRAAALRDRADLAITVGFAAGALVQLVAIVADSSTQVAARWDFDLLPAYLIRVVGGLGLSYDFEATLWSAAPAALLILAGLALLAIVLAALRPTPARRPALVALALSVILFLVPGYWRDAALPLMWSDEYTGTYAARYTVLPALFCLTAILLALQHPPRRWPAPRRRALRVGVLAVVAAAAVGTFYVGDPGRSTVRWSQTLEQARRDCRPGVAVAAEIPVSWPDWRIDLPCGRV